MSLKKFMFLFGTLILGIAITATSGFEKVHRSQRLWVGAGAVGEIRAVVIPLTPENP